MRPNRSVVKMRISATEGPWLSYQGSMVFVRNGSPCRYELGMLADTAHSSKLSADVLRLSILKESMSMVLSTLPVKNPFRLILRML